MRELLSLLTICKCSWWGQFVLSIWVCDTFSQTQVVITKAWVALLFVTAPGGGQFVLNMGVWDTFYQILFVIPKVSAEYGLIAFIYGRPFKHRPQTYPRYVFSLSKNLSSICSQFRQSHLYFHCCSARHHSIVYNLYIIHNVTIATKQLWHFTENCTQCLWRIVILALEYTTYSAQCTVIHVHSSNIVK